MPRPLRIQSAGYVHHVISRGNDRQILFFTDGDFNTYLNLLKKAQKEYPIKIYNYVLMKNHIHLLVEPTEDGSLAKVMEYVTKGYAKHYNKMYDHVGHVFQGRYKSFLVQTEKYFFACSRYIDLNPVKAQLALRPEGYWWGAHQTLGHGQEGPLAIDFHDLYKSLGNNDMERQIAYRAWVNNYHGEELDLLNKRAGILGDSDFKETIK